MSLQWVAWSAIRYWLALVSHGIRTRRLSSLHGLWVVGLRCITQDVRIMATGLLLFAGCLISDGASVSYIVGKDSLEEKMHKTGRPVVVPYKLHCSLCAGFTWP
ncbi:hypothetical protein BDV11DRAFT_144469 [Aspergillus similis]